MVALGGPRCPVLPSGTPQTQVQHLVPENHKMGASQGHAGCGPAGDPGCLAADGGMGHLKPRSIHSVMEKQQPTVLKRYIPRCGSGAWHVSGSLRSPLHAEGFRTEFKKVQSLLLLGGVCCMPKSPGTHGRWPAYIGDGG